MSDKKLTKAEKREIKSRPRMKINGRSLKYGKQIGVTSKLRRNSKTK